MARFTFIAILCIILQSCSHFVLQTITDSDDKIKSDVVYNSTALLATSFGIDREENSEIKAASASGVVVKIDYEKNISYILTVRHFCIAPAEYDIKLDDAKFVAYRQIGLANDDYETYNAFVFYVDEIYDLCIIAAIGTNGFVPISVSSKDIQLGEHVTAIGGPNLIYPAKFDGYVIIDYSGKVCNKCIVIGVPSSEGSSGSPVYNDNHELVGIIVAVNRDNNNITIMTSLSAIKSVLKKSLVLNQ